jgi:ribosomal protein S18 acetylase RimI-like enzyme
MRDNPLPVAAFGEDPERRQRCVQALFGALFRAMRAQTPLVALDGEVIVGATGIAPSGSCQPTRTQTLSMLPSLLPLGPRPLLRVSKWTREWAALDPHQPHSHLGPLAVDAHLRGRGIGSQILGEYCRRLDLDHMAAYLETETEENVRLYRRFGFDVVAEQRVLGRPNWFMLRPGGGA